MMQDENCLSGNVQRIEGERESFLCGTIRGLFGVVSREDPRTKDPRRGVRMYASRVAFPWLRCYPEASSVFTLMKHIDLYLDISGR